MKLVHVVGTALSVGLATGAFAVPSATHFNKSQFEAGVNADVANFEENLINGENGHGPCSEVKPTEEQMAALKEAIYEHKKELITIGGELKISFLTYAHTVNNLESTKADADTAAAGITTSFGKLTTAKGAFANKVLYDILTTEQRQAGFACMVWLEQHRHGGHHRDGQHRPDRRPIPNPEPTTTPESAR